MNSRQVAWWFDLISEILKCALVLAVVTAALSWAMFRVLGVNPLRR